MRLGRVAGGVGVLVLVFAGGAVVAVHRNSQRTVAGLAAHEAELRSTPVTREPVVPMQPGTFAACVHAPPARVRVSSECIEATDAESQGVPASCRALMEDGNRWVETWLRCAQRESIGAPRFEFPGNDAVAASTAGRWLGLHLRVLPTRQQLDECRLAAAHARDALWAFGPSACLNGAELLEPIVRPCQQAFADASGEVQSEFKADVEKLGAQLPSNRWLGTALEVARLADALSPRATDHETLVDRFRLDWELPRVVHQLESVIIRQPDAPVHFDNTGGPMAFDAMIECDQLRDFLKALATSPKPSVSP